MKLVGHLTLAALCLPLAARQDEADLKEMEEALETTRAEIR